jgi:hypothetical protein
MQKSYKTNKLNNKAETLLFIKKIQKKFKKKIAIRSSAKNEDGTKYSNAGKYLSYVNVDPANKEDLQKKIFYKMPALVPNKPHVILIQLFGEIGLSQIKKSKCI